jgi:hypothetical protein
MLGTCRWCDDPQEKTPWIRQSSICTTNTTEAYKP